MNDKEFENFIDNLLIYYPLFYRKVKTSKSHEKRLKYSRSDGYYQIMGMLMSWGPMSISKIGKALYISKPNMTPLIDKLVKDKMVKRVRSEEDRRIVNVEITNEGRNFMFESRESVEETIKENLSNFNNKDLEILNESLENIKRLVLKMNHSDNYE